MVEEENIQTAEVEGMMATMVMTVTGGVGQ